MSVLATPGTVRRAYTRDLIQSFASQCYVRLVGAENLAALAESYIRGETIDAELLLAEIAPCFIERESAKTDIIVLACTHYPFLANQFRNIAPWPVDWLDPAEAIAKRAKSLATPLKDASLEADRVIFTSDSPDFAIKRLMSGFGLGLSPLDH